MNRSPIVDYFTKPVVEAAIAAYFEKHGKSEEVRDDLMYIAARKPAEFLEIVCEYVEKETV